MASFFQPPMSKNIPVPNVTVTKSTPIRYTHTVGNQVISVAPSGSSTNPSPSLNTTTTTVPSATAAATASAITQLTDEQKKIVFEFKQKLASLPPDQQSAYINANKGTLLKQLNFQPTQIQLLKNHQIQLQLSRPQIKVNQVGGISGIGGQQPQLQKRPLPVGAGTIRQSDEGASSSTQPQSQGSQQQPNFNSKQKNIAWIENQIKKDQHEALNPKYKVPFKNKDDAVKKLLRYHVFHELDTTPEESFKAEDDFEEQACDLLDKYHSMMNRYHFLLVQESKRMASSSEEVMLARLWDSEERQIHAREKEDFESDKDKLIEDVPLLDAEKRQQYSEYLNLIKTKHNQTDNNVEAETSLPTVSLPQNQPQQQPSQDEVIASVFDDDDDDDDDEDDDDEDELPLQTLNANSRKRKRTGSGESSSSSKIGLKFARSESGNWKSATDGATTGTFNYNAYQQESSAATIFDQNDNEDSDEEFTLKDVDTERAVGSILDDSQEDDDEDDVDDVLNGVNMDGEDVVAAAFGNDSVQNAINSILDTLPQGDRIETPDINNITGLLDSIEDENGQERDPITEAAVNSIPQF